MNPASHWLLLGCLLMPCLGADDPARPVRVAFVGDIMLDRIPGREIARGGDPFAGVARVLDEMDLVIGNLECVVAAGGEPFEGKAYWFRADPACLPLLTAHFDAVSLGNNHAIDFVGAGLTEMRDRLRRAQLPAFGAGRNLPEARAACVLESHGLRLALLGYNEFHWENYAAGPDAPGIAPCVADAMIADILAARRRADVVIPFLHWGDEYEPAPREDQRTLARRLIDAGATAIVGSHPHVVQTTEMYQGHPIIYSLGNFVFDDFADPDNRDHPERCRIGWILRLTLDRRGVTAWDTVVTRTDDRGFPQVVPGTTGPHGCRRDSNKLDVPAVPE